MSSNAKISLPTGAFLNAVQKCRDIAGLIGADAAAKQFLGDVSDMVTHRGTDLVGQTALDSARVLKVLASGAALADRFEAQGSFPNAAAVAEQLYQLFASKVATSDVSLQHLYSIWTRSA